LNSHATCTPQKKKSNCTHNYHCNCNRSHHHYHHHHHHQQNGHDAAPGLQKWLQCWPRCWPSLGGLLPRSAAFVQASATPHPPHTWALNHLGPFKQVPLVLATPPRQHEEAPPQDHKSQPCPGWPDPTLVGRYHAGQLALYMALTVHGCGTRHFSSWALRLKSSASAPACVTICPHQAMICNLPHATIHDVWLAQHSPLSPPFVLCGQHGMCHCRHHSCHMAGTALPIVATFTPHGACHCCHHSHRVASRVLPIIATVCITWPVRRVPLLPLFALCSQPSACHHLHCVACILQVWCD
jgi:hypothetical protein